MVCALAGGRGHLDVQPHWVTALCFPLNKGLMDGCMGVSTDTLLVGRLDGSVAVIEIVDTSSFRRSELQHCSRKDGESPQVICSVFRGFLGTEPPASCCCVFVSRFIQKAVPQTRHHQVPCVCNIS